MGVKTKNLQNLKERNINVHNFQEIKIENEFQACIALGKYFSTHKVFTVRGDSDPLQYCLPFLTIENDFFHKKEEIEAFVRDCIALGCSMLVSDGKRYDAIQTANVVVLLEGDEIKIEVSEEKVPLRHMYRNPKKITTYCGKVSQNVRDFDRIGSKPVLSPAELERILNNIYRFKNAGEKQFELTVYPSKVGALNQEVVFWQVI